MNLIKSSTESKELDREFTHEEYEDLIAKLIYNNQVTREEAEGIAEDNTALRNVITSQNAQIRHLEEEIDRLNTRYDISQTGSGGVGALLKHISSIPLNNGKQMLSTYSSSDPNKAA